MLNVTDYYEKANQTAGRYHCTPVSVATWGPGRELVCPNRKQQVLARIRTNWNPRALLGGRENEAIAVEKFVVPQKNRNRITIWLSHSISGYAHEGRESRVSKGCVHSHIIHNSSKAEVTQVSING